MPYGQRGAHDEWRIQDAWQPTACMPSLPRPTRQTQPHPPVHLSIRPPPPTPPACLPLCPPCRLTHPPAHPPARPPVRMHGHGRTRTQGIEPRPPLPPPAPSPTPVRLTLHAPVAPRPPSATLTTPAPAPSPPAPRHAPPCTFSALGSRWLLRLDSRIAARTATEQRRRPGAVGTPWRRAAPAKRIPQALPASARMGIALLVRLPWGGWLRCVVMVMMALVVIIKRGWVSGADGHVVMPCRAQHVKRGLRMQQLCDGPRRADYPEAKRWQLLQSGCALRHVRSESPTTVIPSRLCLHNATPHGRSPTYTHTFHLRFLHATSSSCTSPSRPRSYTSPAPPTLSSLPPPNPHKKHTATIKQ